MMACTVLPVAGQAWAAEEEASHADAAQMAVSISDKLFDGDGLARPVPGTPTASMARSNRK